MSEIRSLVVFGVYVWRHRSWVDIYRYWHVFTLVCCTHAHPSVLPLFLSVWQHNEGVCYNFCWLERLLKPVKSCLGGGEVSLLALILRVVWDRRVFKYWSMLSFCDSSWRITELWPCAVVGVLWHWVDDVRRPQYLGFFPRLSIEMFNRFAVLVNVGHLLHGQKATTRRTRAWVVFSYWICGSGFDTCQHSILVWPSFGRPSDRASVLKKSLGTSLVLYWSSDRFLTWVTLLPLGPNCF